MGLMKFNQPKREDNPMYNPKPSLSAPVPSDKMDTPEIFENQKEMEWLTTEEAADYLRISRKCLLNLCSNRKIRHYKFGRRNRFLLSDLRRLLLAQPRGDIHGN